jgi:glycosyltransferase involved in cell wall biosynthesis
MTGAAAPSVSVVVPTRDRPELLRRAVQAIVDQDYAGEVACLVVFDGTEPVLPDVTLREGRTVEALVNERSPGLAGNRNTGILAAHGTLVAFCDDDDQWLPEKLRLQVELMQRHDAVLVSSGILIRYEGREVARLPPTETVSFDDLLRSRRSEIHPSTFLIDRAALLGPIGLVDEAIPGSYAEDYEWLLRAARAGTIAVVQRPLVRVLWHQASYFTAKWETIIQALEYLLARYPEFRRQPLGLSRIYGQIAFAHAAVGRRREARAWARRALRLAPVQPRGHLALVVSTGIVGADAVLGGLHRLGRGI